MNMRKKPSNKLLFYFFEGMVTILPLAITVTILTAIFRFFLHRLDTVIYLIPQQYREMPLMPLAAEIVALIILCIFLTLLGLLVNTLFGKYFVNRIDSVLGNIPFVNIIYRSTRQLLDLVSMDKEQFFMQPVIVEYPSPGLWAIGFNTGEITNKTPLDKSKRYYTIFIPTTPNPTSGFLTVIPEDKIRQFDISIEDAIKLILTGGMVKSANPETTDETLQKHPGAEKSSGHSDHSQINPSPESNQMKRL
ncbi:MAG: DUF502 domain-containing protein [Chitinivibrionales bacterium]|nr:DUF502 domain-containing protein [Chitinivibrionales bacterium]